MQTAYIYDAVRTPRGKGRDGGALNAVTPLELQQALIAAVLRRNDIDGEAADEALRIGLVTEVVAVDELEGRVEKLVAGGDGLVREFEFRTTAHCTLLTERRTHAPWGADGGGDGRPGVNRLNGEPLAPKCEHNLQPGDRLRIETPGGGGYGRPTDRAAMGEEA